MAKCQADTGRPLWILHICQKTAANCSEECQKKNGYIHNLPGTNLHNHTEESIEQERREENRGECKEKTIGHSNQL